MEQYNSYKDSGIQWLGKIPSHWEVKKIRHILSLANEKTKESGGELLSLSQYVGVTPKTDSNVGIRTAEDTTGYNIVHKGQFVMNIMLAWNGSYAVSEYDGIISPAYCVFDFTQECDRRYYNYLLRMKMYFGAFKTESKGIIDSRLRLYPQYFKNFPLIVPPIEEQRSMATYLDKATAEIDKAIIQQQRMIDLLNERKQIIIQRAVTKGLVENVEMKDSGIEWIGKIPAHWEISKSKNYVSINHGSDPKITGDVPVYGSGATSFRTCGEFKNGPTVLLGRKGATLHIPHFITGKYWNVDTAFDVKSDIMNLRYFYYVATCFDYKYYMDQTTLPSMTQWNYKNMKIPIPSIIEQGKIVEYLDNEISNYDNAIERLSTLIDALQERKQIIISEVVTGKIKVS